MLCIKDILLTDVCILLVSQYLENVLEIKLLLRTTAILTTLTQQDMTYNTPCNTVVSYFSRILDIYFLERKMLSQKVFINPPTGVSP